MRRRYDQNWQRTISVPSKPNQRSREEIVEIDGELIQRANRLGGGYQLIQAMEDEPNPIEPDEQFLEEQLNDPERKEESQLIRGDNLPIVDLKKLQYRRKRCTLCANQPDNRSSCRRKKGNRRDH